MKLESVFQYRNLAKEMRVSAESYPPGQTRDGLMMAAENYERLALSLEAIERSRAYDQ